jgi:hypothetical protein
MSREPIRAAYEANAALGRDCPMCDAGPGQWCVDGRGRLRRVPCVGRGVASTATDRVHDDHGCPRDYSEPLHPPAPKVCR